MGGNSARLGSPFAGIRGLPSSAKALRNGTVPLGSATNPPTAKVLLTAILPAGGKATGSSLDARPHKGKPAKKAATIGKGQATVPAGKTVPLKLTLTGAGKRLLKHGPLHATLTIVATGADGATQTKSEALTIKPGGRSR